MSLARRITSVSSVKVWMTTTGPKTSSLLMTESSGIPVKIVGWMK